MQTAKEIRGLLKNIRYYSDKITTEANLQFDTDYNMAQAKGINVNPGSVRFDCLGCIGTAVTWLKLYCDNIEKNLEAAEAQDKVLWGDEYTEEEPQV